MAVGTSEVGTEDSAHGHGVGFIVHWPPWSPLGVAKQNDKTTEETPATFFGQD